MHQPTAARRPRGAVFTIDRALPASTPRAWRSVVAAGWVVLGEFRQDSATYVLVSRDDRAPRLAPALSPRERDAVRLAATGRTNKEIAFELGIAASTVGVHLHRAAAKLGARSRAELIRAALAPDPTHP
jgi:DNA-binding CsgD family transcriptional regulator